jgi:hypothetical protein
MSELSLRQKYLRAENAKWPEALAPVPRDQWPSCELKIAQPTAVYRSRDYLMQVFAEKDGVIRLSVNRSAIDNRGWKDGIPWDDLQRLKREAGFGAYEAIEFYPAEGSVVNVANIRHLWVLPKPLDIGWKKP